MPISLPNTGIEVWNETTDLEYNFGAFYNSLAGILNSNMNKLDELLGTKTILDFNLANTNGKFRCSFNGDGISQHAPQGIKSGDQTWVVDVTAETNQVLSQEIICIYGVNFGAKYLRTRAFDTWSPWEQIKTTSNTLNNIRLVDLAILQNANHRDAYTGTIPNPTAEAVGLPPAYYNIIYTPNNDPNGYGSMIAIQTTTSKIFSRGSDRLVWSEWEEVTTTKKHGANR